MSGTPPLFDACMVGVGGSFFVSSPSCLPIGKTMRD